jgi:hypothetical protein
MNNTKLQEIEGLVANIFRHGVINCLMDNSYLDDRDIAVVMMRNSVPIKTRVKLTEMTAHEIQQLSSNTH